MRARLLTFWEKLNGSFWFVPAVMVLLAFGLALITLSVDQNVSEAPLPLLEWVYGSSPDGVRSLLSTIASSMISVAGVTFSITLATLSLASSQLGPRLINNFMRDRGNQVVLGTFVSNFVYCLLVLRTIRGTDEITFVPHLSVIVAVGLTLVSLMVLIYFFDHVSKIIQAQNMITNIGRELARAIERMFAESPKGSGYEFTLRHDEDQPADFADDSVSISAPASGYLQSIDHDGLSQLAHKSNLIIQVKHRPGHFIAKGAPLASIYPAAQHEAEIEDDVLGCFVVGSERLRMQDIEFIIEQLVEIAIRALSPGINDPFTAIASLDQLGSTLAELAERTIPTGYYYDEDDHLRVISQSTTFEGVINKAFDQIRQHSRADVAVTIRLLEVLAVIGARTQQQPQREALLRQANMIKRASAEAISEPYDRVDVDSRYDQLLRILDYTDATAS